MQAKGIDHVYIKPRTPRLNGKVERSHRIDSEEFYHLLDGAVIDDVNIFNARLKEWITTTTTAHTAASTDRRPMRDFARRPSPKPPSDADLLQLHTTHETGVDTGWCRFRRCAHEITAVVPSKVPVEIAQAPLRTVRPRGVAGYANPRKELARLAEAGLLHRLAGGFYAMVPPDRVGGDWLPTMEAAAAGIGAAEFGAGRYALMGLSAARLHRAIPRAIGVGVIAAPRRRENLRMIDRQATVRFLARDVDVLQVELMQTDLGECLVATPEQTVLDLAHLPKIGHLENEAFAAIRALLPRCDHDTMATIASTQRLGRAFDRARGMAT